MSLFIALLRGTVQALLSVVQICFLIRALLSWFPIREDNPFLTFTAMVTEPFIMPIRALFDRFGWFRDFPIDIAFFVSFLLVNTVGSVLLML